MLRLENVSYKLGKKSIINKISLIVKKGDFVVITGPNGSGKSTLSKLIMGALNPFSGEIVYNGATITNEDITTRANLGISYGFQTPIKIKGITVREFLNIACKDQNSSKYLKQVGLNPDEYLNRDLGGELSGGEMKRIEIASILARDAELMIFDEPEAGIDMWSFDNLIKIFQKLRKSGKTVIVISHQEKLLKCASRILLLVDGKISEVKDYQALKSITDFNEMKEAQNA